MDSAEELSISRLSPRHTCEMLLNASADLATISISQDRTGLTYYIGNIWSPPVLSLWLSTLMLLVIPIQIVVHTFQDRETKRQTRQGAIKTYLKLCIPILTLLMSVIHFVHSNDGIIFVLTNLHICKGWTNVMEAGVFGVIAVYITLDRMRRSLRRSFPLIALWSVMLLTTGNALLNQSTSNFLPTTFETSHIFYITRFLLILIVSVLSCFLEKNLFTTKVRIPLSASPGVPKHKFAHPEDTVSWWGSLTLSWSACLVWIGFRRNLEESDVPELHSKYKCSHVVPPLEHNWKEEETRCNLIRNGQTLPPDVNYQLTRRGQRKGVKLSDKLDENDDKLKSQSKDANKACSLFKALMKTYGLQFVILQSFKIVLQMHVFITPLFTAALMNHIQNRKNESMWSGIYIVLLMFLFKCIAEILRQQNWFAICRLSKLMKSGVTMLVFKKALAFQTKSNKSMSTGELVNLISDDCDRVFQFEKQLFLIVMIPLKVGIALYLLHIYLGASMLVGVAIMLALIPLNSYIGRRMNNMNLRRNEVKEKRVKLMNEIINGIKVLKLYAWERSFMDKVDKVRCQEIKYCQKKAVCAACMNSIFQAIPLLVQISAFGTYLILGGHLDATKGFVAVQLFHTLNHPLSVMAILTPVFMDAYVSLKRITKFLNCEELSPENVTKTSEASLSIRMVDGTFTWEKSSPEPTLRNISIKIPKGKLVAVVGTVGCGKSSLLSAILGEMTKTCGMVEVQGRLAYVPQEAWILNATLQDNVLFGSKIDMEWYHQVVLSCNLKSDIRDMEAGDQTEIGEKGINLSGGQKQRVSLARAVYNDADVYLLDDPLSAVDAHVGKSIFKNVICHGGLLKNKTRVLVTHSIHWLPFVDSIIVMKNGQISDVGTYKELLSKDGDFAQILSTLCLHSSVDEDEQLKVVKHNIFNRHNSFEGERRATIETVKRELEQFNISAKVVENQKDDKKMDDLGENKTQKYSGKLTEEEELEHGAVKMGVYFEYLKAVGLKSASLFVFIYCISLVAGNYKMYMMKLWTDDPLLANTSLSQTNEYSERSWYHFCCFSITGLVEVSASFLFVMFTKQGAFDAANRIHRKLLSNVLKCPMSFFETTPSCRIIHRFSSDISRVDGLNGCLQAFIERFFVVLISLILLIINAPITLLCVVPAIVLYYVLHCIHISTILQLRRYRSKHRSPIFIHFSETLHGLSSVRAYGFQNRFIQTMETKFEGWLKFDIMEQAVSGWIVLRLCILNSIIQAVTGLVVVMDTTMTSGMAGLVLIYAGNFTDYLCALVDLITYVETEIVSLERVLEYTKKPTEAPWEMVATKPSADWPEDGRVVFNNYKARYRDGLDLVLNGVNCDIRKGEKIGIIGRTGAGKSSLMMALFRLIESSSGYIELDNERIAELGLHDLRSKITILPQDPVIFAGTLRMNLDPFESFMTKELWAALSLSHLKSFVEGLPNQLDFQCGEGGKNLSLGQRQLLCLARTLLRQTRILVLDEATAAVDMETDELIQKTIRTEFRECTVLTIAHRLNTILDYDRILVLDQGMVKEFDSSTNLLANENSLFYSLAKDARLIQ